MDIFLHLVGFGFVIASAVYMFALKKYQTGLYMFMIAFGVEAVRGLVIQRDPILILFACTAIGIIFLLIKRDGTVKIKKR